MFSVFILFILSILLDSALVFLIFRKDHQVRDEIVYDLAGSLHVLRFKAHFGSLPD